MKDDKKNFQLDLAKYLSEKDFVYGPEPEIYGGLSGFYSYGLNGKSMKNKIELKIRKIFNMNGFFEVEFPLISPEIVWQASGHLKSFSDPIIICSKCNSSLRADKLIEEELSIQANVMKDEEILSLIRENKIVCPFCKGKLNLEIKRQSLMMKTIVGKDTVAYCRPETATTTYLPFKHYVNFFRGKLPFTVFQIGKAFRNEISPRQHLLRMREFTQAESQMFISKEMKNNFEPFKKIKELSLPLWTEEMQKNNKKFEWIMLEEAIKKSLVKNEAFAWNLWLSFEIITSLGIPSEKIRFRQHHSDERAFYSEDTWDLEVELNSFGWTELVGISDRSNYDLTQHSKLSKQDLTVKNERGEDIIPQVIEIAFGVDRPFYAVLDLAFFRRDKDSKRTVLSLEPDISPIEIGVLPLVNKEGIDKKAKEIFEMLKEFKEYYDDSGSIGRRYARMDSIGTPFCITVDYESLEKNDVTLRERDSGEQIRIPIKELKEILRKLISKEISFESLKKEKGIIKKPEL
ncbi:MAG: glycine--tRNA ligase [Candidatus Pacearchaeota archaeon]